MTHTVSVETVAPRGIAAVRAQLPASRVSATFGTYLDQVYAAARRGEVRLDGQNVFVYRNAATAGDVDVEFGVGVDAPFATGGAVEYSVVPSGEVARATHIGDYVRLGEAHAAVIAWCRANGRELAGPRWEVYAHQGPEATTPRTDVYYLLAS